MRSRAAIVFALLLGVISHSLAGEALTAKNALNLMSPGINLGNTLEAIPKATSWGNPEPNEAVFKAMRSAGFRSIRIPAAWSQYSDTNHTVSASWMNHVEKVVKMARMADLIVMLNVHWDGGWLEPTFKDRDAAGRRLAAFWKQIGTRFKSFDDHLIFAGSNEVHVKDNYGDPTAENAEVQNGYNQLFVDTVRKTGGMNSKRFLVVQSYNTNIGHAVKFNATLPKDSVKEKLMMEVHYYDPYNFTLNEKSSVWQWGAGATDPKVTETWANEAFVDRQFGLMKTWFVDKGVPVLLGEYAAMSKKQFPGYEKFQRAWVGYVTRSAYRHGVVPMLWDIGIDSGLFNRKTGAPQFPGLIDVVVAACK
ncbi:MAG: glycoside hydrolase family 5 protein [Armatimonadota bacterium]